MLYGRPSLQTVWEVQLVQNVIVWLVSRQSHIKHNYTDALSAALAPFWFPGIIKLKSYTDWDQNFYRTVFLNIESRGNVNLVQPM